MRFKKAENYYSVFLILTVSLITLIYLIVFLYNTSFVQENYKAKIASASKMLIFTDKVEYQTGETVEIKIVNSASRTIVEEKKAPITANYDRNLGENFGVGLIEKYIDNSWVVIEPVWRCNSPCYKECKYEDFIKPTKSKIFNWDQKLIICDLLNKKERTANASAGKYRVSAAVYNDNHNKYTIFHSNEFIII